VTLMFRLVADKNADTGQIRGTVSSGEAQPLVINVPYQVNVPEPADGVDVDVRNVGRILKIDVTNIGETTKRTTIDIDQPMLASGGHGDVSCTDDEDSTTCRSDEPLAPGDDVHIHTVLSGVPENEMVVVTATIGEGTDTEEVSVRCVGNLCVPESAEPSEDQDEPSETTEPESTPTTTATTSTTTATMTSPAPTSEPTSDAVEPEPDDDDPDPEPDGDRRSGTGGLRSLLSSLLDIR